MFVVIESTNCPVTSAASIAPTLLEVNAGAIIRKIEAITIKARKNLDLNLFNFTLTSFFL